MGISRGGGGQQKKEKKQQQKKKFVFDTLRMREVQVSTVADCAAFRFFFRITSEVQLDARH